jgi:Type II CAAX prenyl endopeptidase Rce1-like
MLNAPLSNLKRSLATFWARLLETLKTLLLVSVLLTGWRFHHKILISSFFSFCFLTFAGPHILEVLFPQTFSFDKNALKLIFTHIFVGAFKEEILFRSLPFLIFAFFFPSLRRGKNAQQIFVFVSAVLFAIAHYINFNLIQKDPFVFQTLTSIYYFGIFTGFLFILQSNIIGCFALHAGWNLLRFQLVIKSDGIVVSEGMGFNTLEGSSACAVFVAALSLTVFYLHRKSLKFAPN